MKIRRCVPRNRRVTGRGFLEFLAFLAFNRICNLRIMINRLGFESHPRLQKFHVRSEEIGTARRHR
jgi:hypothetical protein